MQSEDIPEAEAGATDPGLPPASDPGTHAPWSIKLMAIEDRNAALAAAKRSKVSVGEWLALAIRTRIEFERGEHLPAVVAPPGPPATLDEIGRMIEMAKMLAEVSQKPPPVTVTRLAYRHLRERLTPGLPRSDRRRARV
jgi:hypothetical protein